MMDYFIFTGIPDFKRQKVGGCEIRLKVQLDGTLGVKRYRVCIQLENGNFFPCVFTVSFHLVIACYRLQWLWYRCPGVALLRHARKPPFWQGENQVDSH